MRAPIFLTTASLACVAALSPALEARADDYVQTNLVSSVSGLAPITDSNLRNPWGMSDLGGSPFWISDQATNVSTLYSVSNGVTSLIPLVVSIPTTASGPQGPTGQVASGPAGAFTLNGSPALFIFANLNGTISAWNGVGTTATIVAATPAAIYTGLAINAGKTMLFGANSATGSVPFF